SPVSLLLRRLNLIVVAALLPFFKRVSSGKQVSDPCSTPSPPPHIIAPPPTANPFSSCEGETKGSPTLHGIWKRSAASPPLQFIKRLQRSPKGPLFVPGQGVVLYPQIGDKLDIVCPRVDGGVGDGVEYYKVYMVPREQLESCTITKADTPLLNCVKPDQDVKFTLKFQEFSPNLWGLEFFKGRDYYIICEYESHMSLSPPRVSKTSCEFVCL
ncbi:hypothetical protein GOODEAATRI_012083, partial [Goodea atripinnis]